MQSGSLLENISSKIVISTRIALLRAVLTKHTIKLQT